MKFCPEPSTLRFPTFPLASLRSTRSTVEGSLVPKCYPDYYPDYPIGRNPWVILAIVPIFKSSPMKWSPKWLNVACSSRFSILIGLGFSFLFIIKSDACVFCYGLCYSGRRCYWGERSYVIVDESCSLLIWRAASCLTCCSYKPFALANCRAFSFYYC